jgi:hypothetical protein
VLWSDPRLYNEKPTIKDSSSFLQFPRVEVGSNTSTVDLRVVGGDEKGGLESETVKYSYESHGIRTRERLRWRRLASIVNARPILSSEKEPHLNKPATV